MRCSTSAIFVRSSSMHANAMGVWCRSRIWRNFPLYAICRLFPTLWTTKLGNSMRISSTEASLIFLPIERHENRKTFWHSNDMAVKMWLPCLWAASGALLSRAQAQQGDKTGDVGRITSAADAGGIFTTGESWDQWHQRKCFAENIWKFDTQDIYQQYFKQTLL